MRGVGNCGLCDADTTSLSQRMMTGIIERIREPMGNKRGKIEVWLDEHNHKMELLRTIFSLIAATTGIVIFLKVFEIIGI